MAIRRGFLLIRAQFVLHSAYSYLIRNWFLNFRAACSNVILLFVMNSCAIPAELSRFSRIFVTKSYLNRDWLVHHHDWRIFLMKPHESPRINKKSIRGNSGDSWPVWNRGIKGAGGTLLVLLMCLLLRLYTVCCYNIKGTIRPFFHSFTLCLNGLYPYSTQATNRPNCHELIFYWFGGIREVSLKKFLQSWWCTSQSRFR